MYNLHWLLFIFLSHIYLIQHFLVDILDILYAMHRLCLKMIDLINKDIIKKKKKLCSRAA